MKIEALYHEPTYTLTYVVWDEETRDAVIIDPVLDYDPLGSQTSVDALKELDAFIAKQELGVRAILETHAHADHLSGSQYLKRKYDAPLVIGEKITVVQETFKTIFDLPDEVPIDGSQFDELVADGETVTFGSIPVEVIATPGHTPACVTYKIDDALFTGDALFMDDYGTGRCDFPKGSATDLYQSIQKLYALPDETRVFVGHDYQPGGREVQWETTIGKSKANNPQLKGDTPETEFVTMREARDATLKAPRLLFQSVQVNVDAGRLPGESGTGIRYLKLPLNLFGPSDEVGQIKT
ncbi:MAG: MBL fold metallo-hydrolase [Deltaproteobacteria bacterium]|nr:MBL fold metallo-hydrolase [Deltaproteobacteria bacterium]